MFSGQQNNTDANKDYDFSKEENAAKWNGVFINSLEKVSVNHLLFYVWMVIVVVVVIIRVAGTVLCFYSISCRLRCVCVFVWSILGVSQCHVTGTTEIFRFEHFMQRNFNVYKMI